jgi:hypothetical protein
MIMLYRGGDTKQDLSLACLAFDEQSAVEWFTV